MRVEKYLQLLTKRPRALIRDQGGQELIEYALLGSLMTLVSIGALASIGTWTPSVAGF